MDVDRSWSHRFLVALPPWSDRAMVGGLLVAMFGAGFATAMLFVATRDSGRGVTETQRLIAATRDLDQETQRLRAQLPSRPPLQQHLDALEQSVPALEHRQTP